MGNFQSSFSSAHRIAWIRAAGPSRTGHLPLARSLRALGLGVEPAPNDLDSIPSEVPRPALVVIELRVGDSSGFAAIEALRRRWHNLAMLVVTDRPTVAEAVHTMKSGATWYGSRIPNVDFERAVRAVLSQPQNGESSAEARGRTLPQNRGIIGTSAAIRDTLRQSALVSPTRTTVLLLGETGTGKERLAQAIHEASPRRHGPFVAINCAALAEGLLESELFGHEKGAFSGALGRREGRFKHADGGTIFLDEIGEIGLGTQVKLLRVLQERTFERVGGNQTLSVDVRVIAATNRNLREMVEDKTFRADLFYRLNVMCIRVPPLRERLEDIPLLVADLIPRLALELGLPECQVTPAAMQQLLAHDWPGNVRELENLLQRLLVMAQGGLVEPRDLLPTAEPVARADAPGLRVPGASFREIERYAILTTYAACGQSPLRTAEMLGISPRTVHYRLREYRGGQQRRRGHVDGGDPGSGTDLQRVQPTARHAADNGSDPGERHAFEAGIEDASR